MPENAEIEAILDAVDDLKDAWSFWPPDEYGSDTSIAPTEILIRLGLAYDKYVEIHCNKENIP